MQARRALLPVVLLAAYAYVHCAPRIQDARPLAEDAMPAPPPALAVEDAPRTIEELRRRIEEVIEREHVPGAAIALVDREGPLWIGGVGVRDRTTRAPIDGSTVFRIGSLTKSMIALAVMHLVDEGKLDVDRPLREILPDIGIDNPWEATAPVTLAQCLEHTAGLDDVRFNEVFTDDEQLSVVDTLAINPRSRKIRWPPGTRHAYSNVGYTIAARAIEVATGEPFDVYVEREILRPLGIVTADFKRTPLLASRLATGYMNEERAAPFIPFAHRPAGALLASAEDLSKLVQFWIRRGEGYPPIVSRAGLARIERSGTLPYPHIDNEYGFGIYGDTAHPVLSRGHDGGMPGFHSSFRYVPELGVGYVMLLNSNYSFRGFFAIRRLLFAYLTRGHTFAPPTAVTAPERPGADYFLLENPRTEAFGFIERISNGWKVVPTAEGIRIDELGGPTWDMVPAADGGYRFPEHSGSMMRFTTNAAGTPVMLMSFLYAEQASEWSARLHYGALRLAMLLLKLAPLWAIAVLVIAAIRRRRALPLSLVLWPAFTGLACFTLPHLLEISFITGVIGRVHPLTVALCAMTIVLAIASAATLISALRWWLRPDRPRVVLLLFPTLCGVAFVGFSLWLASHGAIGFRTWAW